MSRNCSRLRKNGKSRALAPATVSCALERLESRRLLCGATWDLHYEPVVELQPDLIDPKTGISPTNASEVADPANIVWTNRGAASDNFNARFGASAGTARGVVDAVIDYFELMIGSFNYPSAGQTYSLTLSMGAAGSGFGASAGLSTSLGGKPKSGSVTMGAGNGSADPNDDNGWFLDPTPYDNSEFAGNIVNAFAGDAQFLSPAAGRPDFFTVVAAELTHCLGSFGDRLAGWHNKTHNTGVADTSEGGGVGTFWTFNGNFIDHLLTSYDSGAGEWGSALHGAGPGITVTDQFGNNYLGAQDIGNASYETGRRYMVNNTFSLMFKDAYAYSSIDPAQFGTFYSSPFSSTGVVTVRGGTGSSADNIQIFRSPGNKITVSVDIGNDVPGTGTLPGAGNLPAFVSVYDVNQVSSIVVDSGDGDDVIFLDTTDFSQGITQPITINAGNGNDSLTTTFFGGSLDYLRGSVSFNGGAGVDSIVLYDNASTASDTYTLTSNTLSRVNFGGVTYSNSESLHLNAQSGNNIFNINSTPVGMSISLDGRDGGDTFNVGGSALNAVNVDGPLTLTGGNGADGIYYQDQNNTLATTYGVSSTQITRTGAAAATYGTVESFLFLGGSAADTFNVSGTSASTFYMLLEGNGGQDTFFVTGHAPATAITADGGTDLDFVTVQGTSPTTVRFLVTQDLASLNLNSGGNIVATSSGTKVIDTDQLSIAGTGKLDLNGHALIVDYTGATPLASIRAALTSGYNNGAWNGSGISSSASMLNRALGYGESSAVFSSFPATFAGRQVDNTAVLVRYTRSGDANLDQTVNLADFNRLAAGFGTGNLWSQGNFNFDNAVNLSDFNLLVANFGQTASSDGGSGPGLTERDLDRMRRQLAELD